MGKQSFAEAFNSCLPNDYKSLFNYENKRIASKLSKELYAISNLFEDCFDELVTTIEDDDIRKQILAERIDFLLDLLRERSEELSDIQLHLSNY